MLKRSKTDTRNFQDIKPIVEKKTKLSAKISAKMGDIDPNKKWKKTDKWEALW